jgi:DNA-binding transcriptional MerR regulator
MSTFSIKDLEHLSGIKAHTIRIWEQRYELIEPKRTDTNIRYYDDTDLKLILNVALLKDNGFKISKIAQMSEGEM